MIIQVIAAFAAIFTFAMALEIPKKYLINAALSVRPDGLSIWLYCKDSG